MSGPPLEAVRLLGIDVEAELANLSTRQLQGTWQVPAELVRDLLRRGASRVVVRLRRRTVTLRADGVAVEPDELAQGGVACDPAQPALARHRAMVHLEAGGSLALLWALGLPHASVEVVSRCGRCGARLVRTPGRPPRVEPMSFPPGGPSTEVRLTSLDLDQAGDWLRSACRFAPVPVEVNGQRLQPSFPDGLLRSRLERPLPAILSFAASGDAPLLWLLQHGVVSTRATVPGFPPFQAAVELGRLAGSPTSPGALRQMLTPFLVDLVDQALLVLLRCAGRLDDLPERTARRVVVLLLQNASHGLRRSEVESLPLLPSVDREGFSRRGLGQLREELTAGTTPWVLGPDQDPRRFVLGGRSALLLDAEERRLVAELVGLPLEQPPRRPAGLAQLAARLADALRRGIPLTRPGMTVPMNELAPDERRFLAMLGSCLEPASGGPLEAVFVGGRGPARRVGRRLLLPRANPDVTRSVRALSLAPEWLYPATLLLAEAGVEASDQLHRRWLARWGLG